MKMYHLAATTAVTVGLSFSTASAWDQNPFDQYLQRKDTVTLDAGNAKATNTVTHMINPWPPHVFDRRIPGNGERMTDAVERTRNVGRIPRVPCPITPQFDIQQAGVRAGTTTQCGASPPVLGTSTTGTSAATTNGSTTTTSGTSFTAPVFGR